MMFNAYQPLCETLGKLQRLVDYCEREMEEIDNGEADKTRLRDEGAFLTSALSALSGKEVDIMFEGGFGPLASGEVVDRDTGCDCW